MVAPSISTRSLSLLLLAALVAAHEHHDEVSEEETNRPVDAILWIHIFLQADVWGILFPAGMVLGISFVRYPFLPLARFADVRLATGGVDGMSLYKAQVSR